MSDTDRYTVTQKIYKYPFPYLSEKIIIALPAHSRILSVQTQHGVICLWAVVDTEERDVDARAFRIVGTGHPIPDGPLTYLATVQTGAFVWHVFEEVEQ